MRAPPSGGIRSIRPSCATAISTSAGRRSPPPMPSRCSFRRAARRCTCLPALARSTRCAATTSTPAGVCSRRSGGSAFSTACRRCSPRSRPPRRSHSSRRAGIRSTCSASSPGGRVRRIPGRSCGTERAFPIPPRSGSHTVWTGIVPDFTLPAVRATVLAHFDKEVVRRGVSGYKLDEVDGYDRWLWPDHATFPSGLSGEQMRQVFGVAIQRATFDAFHARDQRTYGLVRASNAGAAPLPYVLYNDYYGHQEFVTALASSGFIGVLWTPEVRSSRTSEEWLRRMQSVCFSPLAMLNAWSDGTKPWSFPDVADPVREVMRLRVRLLPYLYSAFASYHFDGVPPVRAMALEPGFRAEQATTPGQVSSTENPYAVATRREVKDQF